jgi:hypothetical protein
MSTLYSYFSLVLSVFESTVHAWLRNDLVIVWSLCIYSYDIYIWQDVYVVDMRLVSLFWVCQIEAGTLASQHFFDDIVAESKAVLVSALASSIYTTWILIIQGALIFETYGAEI